MLLSTRIHHTPAISLALMLGGGKCMAVSGILTPPNILNSHKRKEVRKGKRTTRHAEVHYRIVACLVACLCV